MQNFKFYTVAVQKISNSQNQNNTNRALFRQQIQYEKNIGMGRYISTVI